MGVKRIHGLFVALLMLLCLTGCHDREKVAKQKGHQTQVVTVRIKPQVKYLYFKGSLAPIKSTYVLSDVDGRITKLYANYGAKVEKGQNLASIKAIGLEEKFRNAVTDYLQKKSALEQQKTKFEGDRALFKAGVMAKENFDSFSQNKSNVLEKSFMPYAKVSASPEYTVDGKVYSSNSIFSSTQCLINKRNEKNSLAPNNG